jgi:hypothetical protein
MNFSSSSSKFTEDWIVWHIQERRGISENWRMCRLMLILFCETVYDIYFKNNVIYLQILLQRCNLSKAYLNLWSRKSFECLSSYCTDITFRKPQCVQTNQICCNRSAVRLLNMYSENIIDVIPMWAVTWSPDLAASCKFYVYLTI